MRATVVLPLPLSPTSARAQPGERASEVSSTACTADCGPNSLNWRKGKYLRKCTASRMAGAAGGLVHSRGDGLSSPSPPDILFSPCPPDILVVTSLFSMFIPPSSLPARPRTWLRIWRQNQHWLAVLVY